MMNRAWLPTGGSRAELALVPRTFTAACGSSNPQAPVAAPPRRGRGWSSAGPRVPPTTPPTHHSLMMPPSSNF